MKSLLTFSLLALLAACTSTSPSHGDSGQEAGADGSLPSAEAAAEASDDTTSEGSPESSVTVAPDAAVDGDAANAAPEGSPGESEAAADGSGPDVHTQIAAKVVGAVEKGPLVIGSNVDVSELDSSLNPTGRVFHTTTTNNLGAFSVPVTLSSPYVEITANGYYYDETAGSLSVAPLALSALASVSGDTTIDVNVLTQLIEPRVRALVSGGMGFDSALSQAEAEALAALALPRVSSTHFNAATVAAPGAANSDLLATTLLVEQFATFTTPTAPTAQVVQSLATMGLLLARDGDLHAYGDWSVLRCSVPATLQIPQILTKLANYYASVGQSVTLPDVGWLATPPPACLGDGGSAEASDGAAIPNTSCVSAALCPVAASGPVISSNSCRSLSPDPDGHDEYFVFVTSGTGVMVTGAVCGATYTTPESATVTVYSSCGAETSGDGGPSDSGAGGIIGQETIPAPAQVVPEAGGHGYCPPYEIDLPTLPPGTYWIRISDVSLPPVSVDVAVTSWR
jgi:hypothetical protein